jgi:hypothetical protein
MRFNEKKIRDDRAKSAERRHKSELPEFFPEIEIHHFAELHLPMLQGNCALGRKLHDAEREQHCKRENDAAHNSFP